MTTPVIAVDRIVEAEERVNRLLADQTVRLSARIWWGAFYVATKPTYEDLIKIGDALERARPGSPTAHQ